MRIVTVSKPAQQDSPVSAVVEVTEPTPRFDVITFGLRALNESRSSLWGWGVDGVMGDIVPPGRWTVYGSRT